MICADSFFDKNLADKIIKISLPEHFSEQDFEKLKESVSTTGAELELCFGENEKKLRIKTKDKFSLDTEGIKALQAFGCDIKIGLKSKKRGGVEWSGQGRCSLVVKIKNPNFRTFFIKSDLVFGEIIIIKCK